VLCGFPGNLENGRLFYIGTMSEYNFKSYMNNLGQNKQIRYECDKDYKLIGPNGSTCINGNWKPSIKLAKCVRDIKSATSDDDAYLVSDNPPSKTFLDSKITFYKSFSKKNNQIVESPPSPSTVKASKLKRLKKHKIKKQESIKMALNKTFALDSRSNKIQYKNKKRTSNVIDLNEIYSF
jgi:hypothetical protein